MSISNSLLITDALGLIGVLRETETMTAEQGAHGLRVLNHLMADWEQDGLGLQYYEQSSLTSDTPIPNHAIVPVKYFLAFALAPFYSRPVSKEMLALADKYYARLRRDAMALTVAPTDLSHLAPGSAATGSYDIVTGS